METRWEQSSTQTYGLALRKRDITVLSTEHIIDAIFPYFVGSGHLHFLNSPYSRQCDFVARVPHMRKYHPCAAVHITA
eukprot:6211424-Pleurochrysis_carterae.AAC.2